MLSRLRYISQGARRRFGQMRAYRGVRDVSLTWYDALVRFFPGFPFPGRGRIVGIRMADAGAPLLVRLGTSDAFVLEEIFVRHIYSCVTDADLGAVRVVVDLGANVGLSMRLWAKRYPDATLIGVEPSRANFEICQRNLAVAGANAQLHHAAISNREGKLFLEMGGYVQCAFRTTEEAGSQGEWVTTITMPALIAQLSAARDIDLLKCDVEGAERQLFAECAPWISHVRSLLVEVHMPYSAENLLADLRANGYQFKVAMHQPSGGNDLLFLQRLENA